MTTTCVSTHRSNQSAAITGALALGDVELVPGGTYDLEAPLVFSPELSGRVLYCRGPRPAILRSAWDAPEPIPGAPPPWDDPTHAIVCARGVPAVGGAATTTTAVAPKDSLVLEVTDEAGIAPGAWLRVVSGGGEGDQIHQTDSPLLEFVDLAQVDDSYDGGPVVPLRRPLAMHHRAGAAVTGWIPTRDVRVEGIELVARGAAVGVASIGALGVEVRDVRGSGFSRALVNLVETRGLEVQRLRGLGANNALLMIESCAVGRVLDVSNDERGDRRALTGIPRGLVTIRRRSTGIDLDQIHLVHGCVGVQLWGGQGIRFGSVSARDMCPDGARERDSELNAGHEYGDGNVGAGFDQGTNVVLPPSASEFGYGITVAQLYVEDCHGAHPLDCAVYIHDALDLSIGSCVINNKGLSPYVPGAPKRRGAVLSDCQGHIASLRCTGVDEPLRVRGYWTPSIAHYAFEGAAGWSGPPNIAGGPSLILDCVDMGPIGVLEVHNARNVAFGAQFQGAPDFGLQIGVYRLEWFEAHGVTLADGAATPFNVGDLAEIAPDSPPGRRQIVPSSSASTACVVVVSGGAWDVPTGLHLICPLPSRRVDVMCTVDAVAAGARMVPSEAPGRARALSNDAEIPLVIGRALTGKPAGAEAFVPVGPV